MSRNYGEERVYWYLRLNGFFPITDFVIHGALNSSRTTDCDILAIRPPLIKETIAGREMGWDVEQFPEIGSGKYIGVIAEVKTGSWDEIKLIQPDILKKAIERLGLVAPQEKIINSLISTGKYTEEHACIYLILFCNKQMKRYFHIQISLEKIREWINVHLRIFSDQKYKDRMFFHSPLFQELIDQNSSRE